MKACTTTRQLEPLFLRTPWCPSCSTQRFVNSSQPSPKRRRTNRHASTLSTTAINGKRPIPSRSRPLYDALTEVKAKASAHVSISRLQLAIQGLESERPVTRIAILGLNVQDVARQIARLLLADALEDEGSWEKQIMLHQGANGIIIRYGQAQNSNIPQRTTLPILHVPSPILERLNVELLISSFNAEHTNGAAIPPEAFLAPAVGVPTAFDGRQVTVNQPVHRTLVVAQGLNELVAAIQLLSATNFQSQEDQEAVMLAANLPGSITQSPTTVLVSDVTKAEKGLAAIRVSTSQATTYEHEWLASGMPQVSAWFAQGLGETSLDVPTPDIRRLISSLLTSTSSSLDQTEYKLHQTSSLANLDPITRTRIETAVEDFSRAAHHELQSGLASAWSSRNWRKLSWYKLFWRVDDVGLIISDLVTNTWLPRTERAVYEISGRLTQIGIHPVMAHQQIPETVHRTAFEPEADIAKATILDPAPALLTTQTTSPSNAITFAPATEPILQTTASTNIPTIKLQPPPLPVPITTTISTTRQSYLNSQIAHLTTTAQQLVFRTLSILGLSAGLSALTYLSTIAPTMYEAGTIFAAGTVFALYRMQTGWQAATKALERGLFDEGRDVVRRVVQRMRELVERKAAESGARDPVEERMLEEARGAVERAKREFARLNEQEDVKIGGKR